MKQGQFTVEELHSELKANKTEKTSDLNVLPLEIRKTRKFDNTLRLCNAMHKQNTIIKE